MTDQERHTKRERSGEDEEEMEIDEDEEGGKGMSFAIYIGACHLTYMKPPQWRRPVYPRKYRDHRFDCFAPIYRKKSRMMS